MNAMRMFNVVWRSCYAYVLIGGAYLMLTSFCIFEFGHPIHIEINHAAIEDMYNPEEKWEVDFQWPSDLNEAESNDQ